MTWSSAARGPAAASTTTEPLASLRPSVALHEKTGGGLSKKDLGCLAQQEGDSLFLGRVDVDDGAACVDQLAELHEGARA